MIRRIKDILTGLILIGVALLLSGCAGLVGGYSLSPASFLLPGLIHVDSPKNSDETEKPLFAVSDSVPSSQSTARNQP